MTREQMKEGMGREKEKNKKKKKKNKKTRTRTITTRRPRTPTKQRRRNQRGTRRKKRDNRKDFEDKAFGREKGEKSSQIAGKMACWGLSEAKQPPPLKQSWPSNVVGLFFFVFVVVVRVEPCIAKLLRLHIVPVSV